MANLKELRNRINSVKSTGKITAAMKMVAASRLRRAQVLLGKSSCYYDNLHNIALRILDTLAREAAENDAEVILPKRLTGKGKRGNFLLVVFASDRGLCGGYNVNVVKEASKRIEELSAKDVKVLCIGRKARDILRRKHAGIIIETLEGVAGKGVQFAETAALFERVQTIIKENGIDICEVIYSKFRSAMSREIVDEQIYPMIVDQIIDNSQCRPSLPKYPPYEYEPSMMQTFDLILDMLEKAKFYQTLIHSQASEHGARMTSMDSATRNAKDMISRLTLKYNRMRQSAITTELTEIISGAEAI